jgi:predicted nucleic-acid-binding Zn-ribbon protein
MCIYREPHPSTDKRFVRCPKCGGMSIRLGAIHQISCLFLLPMDGDRYPVKFRCQKCKETFLYW